MTENIQPDGETTWTYPAEPEERRTTVKVAHLVFGLLFVGISGLWLLADQDVVNSGPHLTVLLPALLIVAGVVGLGAAALNTRHRNGELR